MVKRPLKQWMLRITAYADRLLTDLDELNWPEPLKEMQRKQEIGEFMTGYCKLESPKPLILSPRNPHPMRIFCSCIRLSMCTN